MNRFIMITLVVFSIFFSLLLSNRSFAAKKDLSLGVSAQFGKLFYSDRLESDTLSFYYWEFDATGKYRLSKSFAARLALGLEYLSNSSYNVRNRHSKYEFNGEAGVELHFVQPERMIDPYLHLGLGLPDMVYGGAGIKIGGNQTWSAFLEFIGSVRSVRSEGVSLNSRLGVMYHF